MGERSGNPYRAFKMLEAAHLDVIYSGFPPILIQGIDLNSLNSAIRNKAIKV